jgi:drug/metabolite transporter (DMT)-like permease
MVFGSGATIYARKYMRSYDTIEVNSVRMLSAALVVLPLSLILVGFDLNLVDGTGYAALMYAALVGTFMGMMLAFYNIQRFGATAAAMSAYIIPVVTSIGGVLLLNETITLGMVAGMVLIFAGVALINSGSRIRKEDVGPAAV